MYMEKNVCYGNGSHPAAPVHGCARSGLFTFHSAQHSAPSAWLYHNSTTGKAIRDEVFTSSSKQNQTLPWQSCSCAPTRRIAGAGKPGVNSTGFPEQ